jgi:hypothetical protein
MGISEATCVSTITIHHLLIRFLTDLGTARAQTWSVSGDQKVDPRPPTHTPSRVSYVESAADRKFDPRCRWEGRAGETEPFETAWNLLRAGEKRTRFSLGAYYFKNPDPINFS